jgi:DNA-binding Lrp family transcriptional regulator
MKSLNSNEEVKLTKNEQKVLKQIISKEKLSDTYIADSMKLSQQAVNQIRSKLEKLGVIKGYSPIIDFEKIGISIILLIGVQLKQSVWEVKKEWEIENNLKKIPFLFEAYRVVGHNISHALMMGFSDESQRDKFIKKLETVYKDQLDIRWNYSISIKDIILQDPIGLLYQIIDKKEFEFDKLFM